MRRRDMAAVRDYRDAQADEAAADAVALAKSHLVQPWPYAGSIGTEARTLVTSGDGVYLIDGDGRKLIDGPAGMWCINVGHRREELARVAARRAQERQVPPRARERTIVIGDTPHDVACAQVIGARCLAVATGNYGIADLTAAGADVVLADLADRDRVLEVLK